MHAPTTSRCTAASPPSSAVGALCARSETLTALGRPAEAATAAETAVAADDHSARAFRARGLALLKV